MEDAGSWLGNGGLQLALYAFQLALYAFPSARYCMIDGDSSNRIAHDAAPVTAKVRCDVSILKPPTSAAGQPRHTYYLQLVTGHGIRALCLRGLRVIALPSFSRSKRCCPAQWGYPEARVSDFTV